MLLKSSGLNYLEGMFLAGDRTREYEKLERKQKTYGAATAVLGEILKEHPELTQCIQCIGTYIVEKMETNEKHILALYGKHGEGLTVSKHKEVRF